MTDANSLLRRGLLLEYMTVAWNVVGTVVVMVAAMAAHSVALTGFALDSLVEIGASTVVVWQLKGRQVHREGPALRFIAVAFFALALYIAAQSAHTLWLALRPQPSLPGILWLALTLGAMLALAAGKHRTGIRLDNLVLQTEARVTLIDAYLAAAVLLGLVLNAWVGWWWADPLAGLVIVVYGMREGAHAWHDAECRA